MLLLWENKSYCQKLEVKIFSCNNYGKRGHLSGMCLSKMHNNSYNDKHGGKDHVNFRVSNKNSNFRSLKNKSVHNYLGNFNMNKEIEIDKIDDDLDGLFHCNEDNGNVDKNESNLVDVGGVKDNNICNINDTKANREVNYVQPLTVNMFIQGIRMEFKLDTGVFISAISKKITTSTVNLEDYFFGRQIDNFIHTKGML